MLTTGCKCTSVDCLGIEVLAFVAIKTSEPAFWKGACKPSGPRGPHRQKEGDGLFKRLQLGLACHCLFAYLYAPLQ